MRLPAAVLTAALAAFLTLAQAAVAQPAPGWTRQQFGPAFSLDTPPGVRGDKPVLLQESVSSATFAGRHLIVLVLYGGAGQLSRADLDRSGLSPDAVGEALTIDGAPARLFTNPQPDCRGGECSRMSYFIVDRPDGHCLIIIGTADEKGFPDLRRIYQSIRFGG